MKCAAGKLKEREGEVRARGRGKRNRKCVSCGGKRKSGNGNKAKDE